MPEVISVCHLCVTRRWRSAETGYGHIVYLVLIQSRIGAGTERMSARYRGCIWVSGSVDGAGGHTYNFLFMLKTGVSKNNLASQFSLSDKEKQKLGSFSPNGNIVLYNTIMNLVSCRALYNVPTSWRAIIATLLFYPPDCIYSWNIKISPEFRYKPSLQSAELSWLTTGQ